jgi:hypothetical protein
MGLAAETGRTSRFLSADAAALIAGCFSSSRYPPPDSTSDDLAYRCHSHIAWCSRTERSVGFVAASSMAASP